MEYKSINIDYTLQPERCEAAERFAKELYNSFEEGLILPFEIKNVTIIAAEAISKAIYEANAPELDCVFYEYVVEVLKKY